MDLDRYRAEADEFTTALSREYYLHFAGHKETYEIEAIYDRYASLFAREAVEELRGAGNRELLLFAVQGYMGQQTKAEAAELARREATLEIEVRGEKIPLRQSSVVQANADESELRIEIERARLTLSGRELTPLQVEVHERAAAIAEELGWESMLALCDELSGIDLAALESQTEAFLDAGDLGYEVVVEPEIERHLGLGFTTMRRSDLPAFFRAPALDASFPADRLVDTLRTTLAGLGIDLDAQGNVKVDAETRPTKSPRAFCAPVLVPEEVYLVIAPVGGRDDYEALLHEAGHTEHFAHVAPGLPFERRHLGDSSFTEAFAFLFQHLAHEPAWLEEVLGTDPEPITGFAAAVKLIFLRRYSAKLAYERRLHAAGADLEQMPAEYARRLTDALHVAWPKETWISDVDPFFYSARYLRAWALERTLRQHLVDSFGERWFKEPEAGDLLKQIWAKGQRAKAEELLEELGAGEAIEFAGLSPA